jgi:hypothetical protein
MYLSRLLLAIFFFGLAGTAAELVLLEHYEDVKQLIPFGVLAIAVAVGAWYGARRTPASVRAFRASLALMVVSGVVGLVLHYRGNVEFEIERDATQGGIALVWASLTGATPALAPGAMVLLASIGFAATVARSGEQASQKHIKDG